MSQYTKQKNQPIMTGEKTCIRCGCVKPVLEFHKHPMMAEGRLNKCRTCVKECVDEWRLKNPGCRAIEHANNRERKGFSTRAEYFARKSANKEGRKVTALRYAHKRYIMKMNRPVFCSELDELTFAEAKRLAENRAALTGSAWEIDHIVPLMHKKASGLHVAANLQVVPAKWNRDKKNRNMNTFFAME